jgi:hypothetical protein
MAGEKSRRAKLIKNQPGLPKATEPHSWLQSLEAPTLPPGGVALPRDPVLTGLPPPEITHESRPFETHELVTSG